MLALSDAADEDSAAHHVVDASDIFIDKEFACAALGDRCGGYAAIPCCNGEEYNLSDILTCTVKSCDLVRGKC